MNVDKDGIWKDSITHFLPLLLKRMIPKLYEDADFSQELKFLDKELRDTLQVPLANWHERAKYVDSLVEIPLKNGNSEWVLLHIEVPGEGGEDISWRMMLYCCLIFAHYHRMPVALAILTDKRPDKEILGKFEFSQYGTSLVYNYNTFEVYKQEDEGLLGSENPFDAFIYMAKKYKDYRSQEAQQEKFDYLLKMTRHLYTKGLDSRERSEILMLIARLVNLEDKNFWAKYAEEIHKLKGETEMSRIVGPAWIEEIFRKEAEEEVLNMRLAQGRREANLETARRLREMGMSDADIHRATNLSLGDLSTL